MHTDQSKPGSRWLLVLLVLLSVAGFCWVVLVLLPARAARLEWQRYAQSLRAADEPLTLADIEVLRPAVPDDENASLILENLSAAFDAIGNSRHADVLYFDGKGVLTDPDSLAPLPSESLTVSREFLSKHAELIEELELLRGCSTGRLSVDYGAKVRNPYSIMLPNLRAWRDGAKLLRVDAALALENGNVERAVNSLELQFRIAGSLDSEPNFIARMVQISIDVGAVNTLERILAVTTPSAKHIAGMKRMLDERFPPRDLSFSFFHERALHIDVCDGLATGRIDPAEFSFAGGPAVGRLNWGSVRDSQTVGAKLYGRLIAASNDSADLIRVTQLIDTELTAIMMSMGMRWSSHRFVLTLFPSFSRAVELHVLCGAKGAAASCGLAAEHFRMAEGRLPESFAELVPSYLDEIPVDPFDGQPMRFRRTDYGIVNYSIGENMTDDGGDLTNDVPRRVSPDVGFRLLRPALRGPSGESSNTDDE